MPTMSTKDSFRVVTVSPAPDKANEAIGRLTEELKESCTIVHVANCKAIHEVEPTVNKYKPDLPICAPVWTLEEALQIQHVAKQTKPGIVTHALPPSLAAQHGPDAVVEHLKGRFPEIMKASSRVN